MGLCIEDAQGTREPVRILYAKTAFPRQHVPIFCVQSMHVKYVAGTACLWHCMPALQQVDMQDLKQCCTRASMSFVMLSKWKL